MASFAESADLETLPGSAWNYHDGNYLILSQLIRDAGRRHAADVLRFARAELFGPLGMRHVTLEFDGAGTPEGSSQMLAPARDWARFGMLYLNDGVVGGQRILPEGWVTYSARRRRMPMGRLWRGLLDQSRRQFGANIASSTAGRATRSSPRDRSGNMSSSFPRGTSSLSVSAAP